MDEYWTLHLAGPVKHDSDALIRLATNRYGLSGEFFSVSLVGVFCPRQIRMQAVLMTTRSQSQPMNICQLAEVRAARTMDALRAEERAYRFGMRFEAAELRTRSTPYFRNVLAQLIAAAAELQRAGGTPRISLRRCAAVAPRVLLDVHIDGREIEFSSIVDLQGHAYAVCVEQGTSSRIPLIRRWDLGGYESSSVILAHRVAVAEFVGEICPSTAVWAESSFQ